MKTLLIVIFIAFTINKVAAQSSGAIDSAYRIAHKIKDTLLLDDAKQLQIYNINIQLYLQKMMKQLQYTGNNSMQAQELMKIESTRDSLYHTILTDSLFLKYKAKKQYLIVP